MIMLILSQVEVHDDQAARTFCGTLEYMGIFVWRLQSITGLSIPRLCRVTVFLTDSAQHLKSSRVRDMERELIGGRSAFSFLTC